jgi:transcriptional regulator with GAF, ATPase, and Fis domain
LAKTLLESELFGHEKGAFTGADQTRIGRFELANGGTIFLDEIGEVPLEVQVKLLRVLQEREIQRVGGNKLISVDVRLVAATNKNLEEEVRAGRFRDDLFYRLNVISVKVPPLRERKEDIPNLALYFLKKYCSKTGSKLTLPEETLQYLMQYDWPGNVRELENIIERAVILSPGPTIDSEDLNLNLEEMLKVEKVDLEMVSSTGSVRSEIQERDMRSLREILLKTGGNISEAARLMGIGRTTLFYRLKKYHLV